METYFTKIQVHLAAPKNDFIVTTLLFRTFITSVNLKTTDDDDILFCLNYSLIVFVVLVSSCCTLLMTTFMLLISSFIPHNNKVFVRDEAIATKHSNRVIRYGQAIFLIIHVLEITGIQIRESFL